jgi:hypothetical protein
MAISASRIAMIAEQQGAAYTADRGPSGMKVKNTSTPL